MFREILDHLVKAAGLLGRALASGKWGGTPRYLVREALVEINAAAQCLRELLIR